MENPLKDVKMPKFSNAEGFIWVVVVIIGITKFFFAFQEITWVWVFAPYWIAKLVKSVIFLIKKFAELFR